MQALDAALFELINASASAPAWSIHFARFASEVLPALLAAAIFLGALVDRRLRYACFTALVSVLAVWLFVNVFRSAMPFHRPAFYGLGIQWAPQRPRSSARTARHQEPAFNTTDSAAGSAADEREMRGAAISSIANPTAQQIQAVQSVWLM